MHLAANFSFLTPNAGRWRLHSNGKHETLQKNDHRPTNHVLVSLDLWILAKLPHSFCQICQFIGNLPGTHNLSVAACKSGQWMQWKVSGHTNAVQPEVCSAHRRNYIAIQIGGFFAEICAEERGDLWEVLVESGASTFSRAKIVPPSHSQPTRVKHTGQR